MAASLLIARVPMTPLRVMGMVACVAALCLVFSALTTPDRTPKLGASLEQPVQQIKRDTSGRTMAEPSFWKNYNFTSEKIPPEVDGLTKKVAVNTSTINIMGANTFYREANPPDGVTWSGEVVVLLHGAAFQSKTWLDLNTIHTLAAIGHRVIAIDLPGYGNTRSTQLKDKAEYLSSLMSSLKVKSPILVSPSMSGGFSIPYIKKYPQGLGGFVPVAPVGTQEIANSAASLTVPTLIIFGEKDVGLGHTSRDDLKNIPTSGIHELKEARHPAYLDQPETFHTLLYNFIKQVHAHRALG